VAPSVVAAWNLHERTAEMPLDFFVLCGSVASLSGAPGEAAYAAANALLDAIASHRRGLGLPALAINWGHWNADLLGLPPQLAGQAFEAALSSPHSRMVAASLDARRWTESNPNANAPLWSTLLEAQRTARPAAPTGTAAERLKQASVGARRELLIEHLRGLFAQALRLKIEKVDPTVALGDLGLTSLISLEIRNQLEQSLGLSLSVTLLFTYATIQALADHLMGKLFPDTAAPSAPPVPQADAAIAEQVERMSPSELLALFA